MRGQIQAAEVPHQVPEDDGMLTEELVGIDHLDENNKSNQSRFFVVFFSAL